MFSTLTTRAALVGAVLLASACAQAPHRPLDVAQREALKSTEVVGVVPQTALDAEIIVQDSSAATAQFGLLGALVGGAIDAGINASRASKANDAVAPVRAALAGFDFDASLRQELHQALAPVGWLGAREPSIEKTAGSSRLDKRLVESQADGTLFVNTRYTLSPDFTTLRVYATTALFARPPAAASKSKSKSKSTNQQAGAKTDPKNALYHNTLYLETALATKAADAPANAAQWAADAGDPMRRALATSVRQLAALIAADLEYVPLAPEQQKTGERWGSGGTAGWLVSSTPEGHAIRLDDGTLRYTGVVSKAEPPALAATPAPEATATAEAPAEAPAAASEPAAPTP